MHATVSVVAGVDDPSEIVLLNRGHGLGPTCRHVAGITMGSQLRRKPHALNLLHQMRLLEQMHRQDVGGFEVL